MEFLHGCFAVHVADDWDSAFAPYNTALSYILIATNVFGVLVGGSLICRKLNFPDNHNRSYTQCY